jgi:hypothetical protein
MIAWIIRYNDDIVQDNRCRPGDAGNCFATVNCGSAYLDRESGSCPIAEYSRYTNSGELTIDLRGPRLLLLTMPGSHASLINYN